MPWKAEEADPEWPFELMATDFLLKPETTTLLSIDMHESDMKRDLNSPMGERSPGLIEYWNERMEQTVLPNTCRLLEFFRERQLKIAYTRNGHVTSTGAEVTARLKKKLKTPLCARHSGDNDIDSRLAPREEDLVVDKLTSGAFTSTFLDHALRNMGITAVIVTGIVTDMCVFGTARTAAELGYDSLICEDACVAFSARSHNEALLMHARRFGRVAGTEEVIEELSR
ncbi:MAG: isochorismatase family cysteine hydrolase [Planctomycetota bacterium]|jgi:nicotinamidase-related amidase|nr:isochorismatase family cysteine hydrolase [Planctomycetota bacterium]